MNAFHKLDPNVLDFKFFSFLLYFNLKKDLWINLSIVIRKLQQKILNKIS